ncbi:unnamed protein product [Rotaria sp. Silwood1]|nr:unnamed protein product [Rotaria sp. Silwood1]
MNQHTTSATDKTTLQTSSVILLKTHRIKINKLSSSIRITQELVDQCVEQKKALALVVKTSKPSNKVVWFKNTARNKYNETKRIFNDNKFHLISQTTVHILIISAVKLDDTGEYFCRIENTLTYAKIEVINEKSNTNQQLSRSLINKSTSYDFNTFEEELKLIHPLPEQIRLDKNDKLIVFCETNRKPNHVQWFKNESSLSSISNNFETYYFDSISILILYHVNEEDSGLYTCYLGNYCKTRCTIQIDDSNLIYIDKSIAWEEIIEPIESIHLKINKAFISFKWYHPNPNEENLPDLIDNKFKIVSESSTQELELIKTKKTNLIKYFLSFKLIDKQYQVIIIDLIKMKINNDNQDSLIKSLNSIETKQVTEGDDLIIEIIFQHDRNLLLKDYLILLKNNVPLYNDFEINPSDDTSSELSHWIISLSDINLNDEGVYSIYINQNLKHLFVLSIKPCCLQRKSIILSKDKFNLHENLEFIIQLEEPLYDTNNKLMWFKNGYPIESSNQHMINTICSVPNQSTTHKLIIQDITFADQGIYSLCNSNVIFETSFIHVFRMPIEPPSLLHTVIKSSDYEINLIIKNLSDQYILLYKDNQALQDLTKMITYVDNEKIQLKFNNIKLYGYGIYQININNNNNNQCTTVCSFNLIEQQKEKCSIDINQNILKKDDLILLCIQNKNIILNEIQLLKNIPPSTETEEIKISTKKEQNKYMIMPRLSKLNSVFNLLFYYRCVSSEIEIDSKFFYNDILKNCDVIVTQDIANISRTTISTDYLSTCYLILMSFNLDHQCYAYLKHHSRLITKKISAPELLSMFLEDIWIEISTILSKKFRLSNTFRVNDLKHLQLVIGGGTHASRDAIRNAFALLINPDQSILDMIFKHCNIDCRYLVNHLINKIIIIKSITCAQTKEELELMRNHPNDANTILPANLWVTYNCSTKECIFSVRWTFSTNTIDLALMKIDLFNSKDLNQFVWKFQNKHIQILRHNFRNRSDILEKFEKCFLYINQNSLFIPSVIDYSLEPRSNDDPDEDEDDNDDGEDELEHEHIDG